MTLTFSSVISEEIYSNWAEPIKVSASLPVREFDMEWDCCIGPTNNNTQPHISNHKKFLNEDEQIKMKMAVGLSLANETTSPISSWLPFKSRPQIWKKASAHLHS